MPYFDDQTRLMQALFAAAATRPISAEKAGPWRLFFGINTLAEASIAQNNPQSL